MGTYRGAYIYQDRRDLLAMNAAVMAGRDPRRALGGQPDGPAVCGTNAGQTRHRKAHEAPCDACRAAHKEHEAARRRRRIMRQQEREGGS